MDNSNKLLLKEKATRLVDQIGELTIPEVLAILTTTFHGEVCFSTSFSAEDQVVTHHILSSSQPIEIFTLDTGRLFAETYAVWSATTKKYQAKIKAFYPNERQVETYVTEKGPNAFYESVSNRKECCRIRKVDPLKRALLGHSVWITGLRAEQSQERMDHQVIEWDEGNQVIKYNPLLHWNSLSVRAYIDRFDVPVNPLHDKGFVSIGCAPCTRAVRAGEDFRAGRWWWEDNSKKECGLHVSPGTSELAPVK